MTNRSRSVPTIFAIVIWTAFAAASMATPAHAEQPAAESAQPDSAASIDEAKLDKFVTAYSAVQQIQKEAIEKQNATTDVDAAQALSNETQTKMSTAVKTSGLEVEEFNRIAQLMLKDVDLRNRVAAKMQERSSAPGG